MMDFNNAHITADDYVDFKNRVKQLFGVVERISGVKPHEVADLTVFLRAKIRNCLEDRLQREFDKIDSKLDLTLDDIWECLDQVVCPDLTKEKLSQNSRVLSTSGALQANDKPQNLDDDPYAKEDWTPEQRDRFEVLLEVVKVFKEGINENTLITTRNYERFRDSLKKQFAAIANLYEVKAYELKYISFFGRSNIKACLDDELKRYFEHAEYEDDDVTFDRIWDFIDDVVSLDTKLLKRSDNKELKRIIRNPCQQGALKAKILWHADKFAEIQSISTFDRERCEIDHVMQVIDYVDDVDSSITYMFENCRTMAETDRVARHQLEPKYTFLSYDPKSRKAQQSGSSGKQIGTTDSGLACYENYTPCKICDQKHSRNRTCDGGKVVRQRKNKGKRSTKRQGGQSS